MNPCGVGSLGCLWHIQEMLNFSPQKCTDELFHLLASKNSCRFATILGDGRYPWQPWTSDLLGAARPMLIPDEDLTGAVLAHPEISRPLRSLFQIAVWRHNFATRAMPQQWGFWSFMLAGSASDGWCLPTSLGIACPEKAQDHCLQVGLRIHHDLKANLLPEALAFLGPTVAKSATPLRRVRSGRAFTYEMLRAREVVPPLPAVTGGSFGRAFSVAAKMSGPQAPRQAARSWDRWQRTLVPAALVGTGGLLPGVRLSLDYCWALDKLLDEPDQSFAARVVGRYMLETTGKVTRRVHRSDPEIEQLYQQALECFTKSSDLALLGDVSLTGMSRVYHNEMTLDHYHGRFDRTLRSHSLDDCSGSAVRFAELLVTLGELKEGAAWARLAERLSAQAVDERGPVAALLAGLQSALSARDREAALEWGRQITDRVRAGSWAHSLPFRHRADEAALSGALTWMRLLLWPEQARHCESAHWRTIQGNLTVQDLLNSLEEVVAAVLAQDYLCETLAPVTRCFAAMLVRAKSATGAALEAAAFLRSVSETFPTVVHRFAIFATEWGVDCELLAAACEANPLPLPSVRHHYAAIARDLLSQLSVAWPELPEPISGE